MLANVRNGSKADIRLAVMPSAGPPQQPVWLDGAASRLQTPPMLIGASIVRNTDRSSGVSAAGVRGLPGPHFHGGAAP
jgi:hypothetical protein